MDHIMDLEKDFDAIKGIAKEAGREGSLHTLEFLGFDVANPTSVQKDVAHLHNLRKRKELIGNRIITCSVTVMVSGMAGLIWYAFQHSIN